MQVTGDALVAAVTKGSDAILAALRASFGGVERIVAQELVYRATQAVPAALGDDADQRAGEVSQGGIERGGLDAELLNRLHGN